MVRFALDEDFPDTILESLRWGVTEAELLPMRHLDKRLRGLDDWQLLLALHHMADIDGLITTDTGMLNLPRELAVIHQANLTVVFVERAGTTRSERPASFWSTCRTSARKRFDQRGRSGS